MPVFHKLVGVAVVATSSFYVSASSATVFSNPDPCEVICTSFTGACDRSGSRCKDDHACHNLYWSEGADGADMPFCKRGDRGCDTSRTVHCVKAVDWLIAKGGSSITPPRAYILDKLNADLARMARDGESKRQELVSRNNPFANLWTKKAAAAAAPVAPHRSSPNYGIRGIRNAGLNCYAIAVLQVFLHTRVLRDSLLGPSGAALIRSAESAAVSELKQLVDGMWTNDDRERNTPLDIGRFLDSVRPAGSNEGLFQGESHDAAKALEVIGRELLKSKSPEIRKIFNSSIFRSKHCAACNQSIGSSHPGAFVRRLDVPDSMKSRKGNLRLEDLISISTGFSSVVPTGSRCEGCEERNIDRFTNHMDGVPNILAFYIPGTTGRKTVEFPAVLDMTAHVEPSKLDRDVAIYVLRGTVIHSPGHFTAQYTHPDTESWYHANDSRVTPVAGPKLVGADIYVAIYELAE